ncbi:hypothetical protein [Hymenobacter rubidus]|uniref:hypothetical protein n=1 Tax=Hymenobacter rubidus TaxID=1441626 RepID=UPI00191CD715|nr:hypothetical protein [Hymenobacter rubidus]
MKMPLHFRLSLLFLFLLAAPLAQAQTPATIALPGYWNVETNLTSRDYTTVRFYSAQDQLVYEETLPDRCPNLARHPAQRRRTAQRLNLVLQQVLRDPTAGQANTLLAQQFGPSRRTPRVYAAR